MRCRIIRSTLSGLMAAAVALSCAAAVSAEGIEIGNPGFENDIWSDGGSWSVECDWDAVGSATVADKAYSDGANQPDGSEKGLSLWVEKAGVVKVTQDVTVPEGGFTVTADVMGENANVKLSLGDNSGDAVTLAGWGEWGKASVDVDGDGSTKTLTIIFDATDGGWGWVDNLQVTAKSSEGGDDSTSEAEDSSSKTEDSSSKAEETSSKAEDSSSKTDDSKTESKADDSKSDASSQTSSVPTSIQNGDFEKYSETELAWWTVDWKDNLKIWFADAEAKNARADKNNNYLNVWAENADHFSMKQTVHLKAGTYGVKFNLDANEGYDTGVKLKVGSLVDYTLPKGEGWEKWTVCETPAFTVKDEGDYEIEFYGDLKKDAWFALDNITLTDGKGNATSSNSSTTGTTGSTSSTSGSSSASDTKNAETGAADTAAALMAVMAVAGAGMVVSKKKSRK